MTSLRILYLGTLSPGSTSAHRSAALERLGHEVVALDPASLIPHRSKFRAWLDYRTGFRLWQKYLHSALRQHLLLLQPDPMVVWVDSGELFGPFILCWLRTLYSCPFILYNVDDPSGSRDWNRFSSLREALNLYDLCVCVRDINVLELLALGAQKVQFVWRSYDETIHSIDKPPFQVSSEISFVGTNIPAENRDRFLLQLLEAEIPLSIHGARWQRSKYWSQLRPFCQQAFAVDSGYTALLSQSAFCLGLLSHRNRDLHTQRSLEATAASSVLLAERTSEHQLLYEEGVEALFWQTPQECACVAKRTLGNNGGLASVRHSGHQRVVQLGVGNEDICRQILSALSVHYP